VCGHYTQVVWSGTTHVGCAAAIDASCEWAQVWVCQYSPPGNYMGQTAYSEIEDVCVDLDNDDVFQRRSLVMALVAAAAAEPAAGKALLDEAQATYARLPAEFRGLNSTAFVSQRLAELRR